MFLKASKWADGRGEDRKSVGSGRWQVLVVELAEPFLLAQLVELGGDDRGGALVGGPSELGVELECGGTFGVAEAASHSIQVGPPSAAGWRSSAGVPSTSW